MSYAAPISESCTADGQVSGRTSPADCQVSGRTSPADCEERTGRARVSIFGRGASSNPFETRISMRGLYAIVDVTTLTRRHLSVLEVASAVARAQPAALQLRAKDLAPRETLQLLRAIHPVCRESG